jgi:alanine dehydrogenase
VAEHGELGGGVNVVDDQITHPAVAASLGVGFVDPEVALASR